MTKLLFVIAVGASTMVVLALAVYFELGRFQPANEVRRMQAVMSQLETVKYKAGLSRSYDQADRTTSVLATGQLNFTHPYSIEHGTSFRVVDFSRSGESSDVAGEVMAINEDTFIKFEQPGAVIDGQAVPEADTWIRFDNPFGSSVKRAFLPSAREDRQVIHAWSPESLPRLRALVAQTDVLQVAFDGETEIVNGVNTRVLDARVDPDAGRAFLLAVVRTRQGREPNTDERLFVESLARTFDPMYVRLWIGIKDHRLYRLQATGVITQERDRQAVDLKIELTDFNAAFLVQAPDQFQDFSSLSVQANDLPEALTLSPQTSGWLTAATADTGHLPLAGRTSAIPASDPDHDGLDNMLEFFYGTDPNHPDTDRDGVSDGDEVLDGRNPRGQGSLFGFGLGG
ncbi:hypothetical protein KJ611_01775 [Patescibacteria group bacterium]|nr:hypothetical protein [Patescibacteria group bacterium]MBU1705128.1 hypothetical protein [Patescibacteria group bacterium]